MERPHVVILGGPNGAGKSTIAEVIVHEDLGIRTFVNADTIARGLAAFDPAGVAVPAGKVMLNWIAELVERRWTFAFETTMAGKTWTRRLQDMKKAGYHIHNSVRLDTRPGGFSPTCRLPRGCRRTRHSHGGHSAAAWPKHCHRQE